jgi:FkbM family methyltransferase
MMVKRLLAEFVQLLIAFYLKLPVQPFRRSLTKLYHKYYEASRKQIIVVKIKGIKYALDLNEFIDSSIYYRGSFEPITTATMSKYVKPGMTVIDIGANIGCHTLRYAKLVGKKGKVIAFEPMQWALSKLKRNIELNDFDNIVLEKIALSDVSGKRSAYFRSSYTLDNRSAPDSEVLEDINFLTLDEYVDRNQLNRIDFIKLDVDGYEYKVIRGGLNTIAKFKPVIIMELGEYTLREHGDKAEDLIGLLASADYSFYSEKDIEKYPSKRSLLDAVPQDSTINVLCKP